MAGQELPAGPRDTHAPPCRLVWEPQHQVLNPEGRSRHWGSPSQRLHMAHLGVLLCVCLCRIHRSISRPCRMGPVGGASTAR